MIKPLNNYIVIKLIEREEKSIVMLWDKEEDRYYADRAIVVEIGNEVKEIKNGDKIVFNKFTDLEVDILPKDQRLLEVNNVIGVLE